MIELYLSKVTESSETEMAGKMYARVSYKQTMDLHDMAHHMAEHNTAFSEGLIVGVLTDFVKSERKIDFSFALLSFFLYLCAQIRKINRL